MVFHVENLKPPNFCSDIHKEVVVFRKLWHEKYSLGNSEGVNIHLCQYNDILSAWQSSLQISIEELQERYRRNRMLRVHLVVNLLLVCQGKQLEYIYIYVYIYIYNIYIYINRGTSLIVKYRYYTTNFQNCSEVKC